jgi:hypothetical protein
MVNASRHARPAPMTLDAFLLPGLGSANGWYNRWQRWCPLIVPFVNRVETGIIQKKKTWFPLPNVLKAESRLALRL